MIIKRKFRLSDAARDQLLDADIQLNDPRVLAARWYLERDTRHSLLRRVTMTASGETLWAFRTKGTPKRPALVLYVTVTGGMQDVTVVGVMGVRHSDET